MQPRPSAETSKPFCPSFLVFICVVLDPAIRAALRLRPYNAGSAIRRAKFLPRVERHERKKVLPGFSGEFLLDENGLPLTDAPKCGFTGCLPQGRASCAEKPRPCCF